MSTKTAGEYRKDIYAIFEEVAGKKMNEGQHGRLKHEIQRYLLEHGAALVQAQAPTPPTVHKMICTKCSAEETATGTEQFKKARKKISAKDHGKEN